MEEVFVGEEAELPNTIRREVRPSDEEEVRIHNRTYLTDAGARVAFEGRRGWGNHRRRLTMKTS